MTTLDQTNAAGIGDLLTTTRETTRLITQIIDRYRAARQQDFDVCSLEMDLTVCGNAGSVNLETLLGFGIGDLCHDVAGIVRHLDRATGKLTDCFWPRSAPRSDGGS